MNSALFTDRVKALGLPLGQCIVIGSGIMGALNIRESSDIDLVVTKELFADLKRKGWRLGIQHNEEVLQKDDAEVWLTWSISGETAYFDDLMLRSMSINGVQFTTPEYVMQWKQHMAHPKDVRDVKLLEKYIQTHE